MSIHIRNPHSVLAALEHRPKDVQQVIIPPGQLSEGWSRVIDRARQLRIPVVTGGGGGGGGGGRRDSRPQRGVPDEGGRTSVAEAVVLEKQGISAEELFADARERNGGNGLWLALDCLQDPQNVGAIFRAAAFFGVQGILITQERSAPMSGTVYDVASGGVETVPFTLQTNLQRAFEVAKEAGLWILGTSEHAKENIAGVGPDRPWLMVLGNEEKGMRRLTEEACDMLIKIPPVDGAGVTSLNVSVASGILISHLTGALAVKTKR